MAYGQSGTGKTFTLSQFGEKDRSTRGIVLRSMEDVLAEISSKTDSISVSYFQLCRETIQDLLNPRNESTQIVEDPKTGVVSVSGATLEEVRDQECFIRLLQRGESRRETKSSQSHAILTVHVRRYAKDIVTSLPGENGNCSHLIGNHGMPPLQEAKLLFVDLASSEHVDKSGTEEAESISLSLSVLGKCINALANNCRHVPFHDSKLTMLLRDLFGGTSTASLIFTIGPSPRHMKETESTLSIGHMAMKAAVHDEQRITFENKLKSVEEKSLKALERVRELSSLLETERRLRRDAEEEVKRLRVMPIKKRFVRSTLYHKVKHIVVKIRYQSTVDDGSRGQWHKYKYGTGIVLNSGGDVLTSARILEQTTKPPEVSYFKSEFFRGKGLFVETSIVRRKPGFDLAILRPTHPRKLRSWAKFVHEDTVPIGTRVFSVCHPLRLYYSLLIGHVSFPCRRIREFRKVKTQKVLPMFNRNLKVIQLDRIDMQQSGAGGPVFKKDGRVLGMLTFVSAKQAFAVHPTVLRTFLEGYVED